MATRRRVVLSGIAVLGLLLAVAGAFWAWTLHSGLSDISRFEIDRPGGEARPAGAADEDALTVLLVGVDHGQRTDLQEMLTSGEWESGVFRSDAIMVLHLPADRAAGHLVSIPRDSWVPVDGHGHQKINAAFSFGGPSLLARTVEQVGQVRIDHVMVVDWAGFRGITETMGGVEIDGEDLDAQEALDYVRERTSLPRGDFDRVERQRRYLLAVLRGLREYGAMSNPVKLTELVGELSSFVSVDSGLTNRRLIDIGWSSRGLDPDSLRLATAPHDGTDLVGDQSVVRLDVPATRALFARIIDPR